MLLDRIKFMEQNLLRKDTWVNPFAPSNIHELSAAAQMDWYLPIEKRKQPVPDFARAKIALDHLVQLGHLVVLGSRNYPWIEETLTLYATPGFKAKHDTLWAERRYGIWEQAQKEGGVIPFEPR